jgi:hypothetical protein
MTALEITTKNYNRFEDKKEITELSNAIFCIESDYAKRDDEGNKIAGFESGVFFAVANVMRNEFVKNKRYSSEIREFCVEVMKEMKY